MKLEVRNGRGFLFFILCLSGLFEILFEISNMKFSNLKHVHNFKINGTQLAITGTIGAMDIWNSQLKF